MDADIDRPGVERGEVGEELPAVRQRTCSSARRSRTSSRSAATDRSPDRRRPPCGRWARRASTGGLRPSPATSPSTKIASCGPGQGGMVTPTASSGSSPSARNWKDVPTGMSSDIPGCTSTTNSPVSSFRHIRPRPATKYQSSSTLAWRTARETAPGASRKWAMLPRSETTRSRTSEPSGANTSAVSPSRLCPKREPRLSRAASSAGRRGPPRASS